MAGCIVNRRVAHTVSTRPFMSDSSSVRDSHLVITQLLSITAPCPGPTQSGFNPSHLICFSLFTQTLIRHLSCPDGSQAISAPRHTPDMWRRRPRRRLINPGDFPPDTKFSASVTDEPLSRRRTLSDSLCSVEIKID